LQRNFGERLHELRGDDFVFLLEIKASGLKTCDETFI